MRCTAAQERHAFKMLAAQTSLQQFVQRYLAPGPTPEFTFLVAPGYIVCIRRDKPPESCRGN